MRHVFFISLLCGFSLLFISGCGAMQQNLPKMRMQSLEKNAIVIGSGGGFSGLYTGYVITHGGDVFSWRSATGSPDSLELLFHAAPDSVNFFFRYLDEIGFNDLTFNSSGNMNSSIERISPDSKHRLQWAQDGGVSAPPEVSAFFKLAGNYARRHSPKP